MSNNLSQPGAAPLAADAAHRAADLTLLQAQVQLRQDILDALPMHLVVYEIINRTQIRLILANQAVLHMSGFTESDLIGKLPSDFFPPDEAERALRTVQMCVDSDATVNVTVEVDLPHGRHWLQCACVPLRDSQGRITRAAILMQDVTEQKEHEQTERQRQEDLIVQQQATLMELSTPLLTISDTTVVMPLVGAIDTRRVEQIIETLLIGVAASPASTVILDITGVALVDTEVANAFIRASQAVSLLGAQVVLTGIRPEVAQMLVGLGVDLRGIITRSTLRDGISYALRHSSGKRKR
jgi:PAS domain S-box-containing protein